MGNSATKNKKADSLDEAITEYASRYILRASFQDMINMSDSTFCEDLVVITTELLDSKMTSIDVEKIISIGKYATEKPKREKIHHTTKKKMKSHMDRELKLSYCRGIARYYVKVLNLFSAVVMTVNPKFEAMNYKETKEENKLKARKSVEDGRAIQVSFSNDDICGRRLKALKSRIDGTEVNERRKNSVCGMNENRATLGDESGISDLEDLYLDEYDARERRYTKQSSKMKQKYDADLKRFYKAFTGNDLDKTIGITKFSQIPLHDYQKEDVCKTYAQGGDIVVESEKTIFVRYANHIKKMMRTTNQYKLKLLNVLNELFEEIDEPASNSTQYRLKDHPESKIDEMIQSARKEIVEMYAKCEEETREGLKIFQAVIETQTGLVNITKATAEPKKDPPVANGARVATQDTEPPAERPRLRETSPIESRDEVRRYDKNRFSPRFGLSEIERMEEKKEEMLTKRNGYMTRRRHLREEDHSEYEVNERKIREIDKYLRDIEWRIDNQQGRDRAPFPERDRSMLEIEIKRAKEGRKDAVRSGDATRAREYDRLIAHNNKLIGLTKSR